MAAAQLQTRPVSGAHAWPCEKYLRRHTKSDTTPNGDDVYQLECQPLQLDMFTDEHGDKGGAYVDAQ